MILSVFTTPEPLKSATRLRKVKSSISKGFRVFRRNYSSIYSWSNRYSITSNCSAPTVPMILRPLNWFVKSWATPSSINWSTPFANCLDFIGSAFSIYLNNSGEKLGIPLKWSFSLADSQYMLQMAQENYKKLIFHFTSEF